MAIVPIDEKCFSDAGTDKDCGHREKIYYDTFALFLQQAYNQPTGCNKNVAEVRYGGELIKLLLCISDTFTSYKITRTTTMKIYIIFLNKDHRLYLESVF